MSADLNLKIEKKYLGKTATFINYYHQNQTLDKAIIYKVEFMWGNIIFLVKVLNIHLSTIVLHYHNLKKIMVSV